MSELLDILRELVRRWDAPGFFSYSHEELVNRAKSAIASLQEGEVPRLGPEHLGKRVLVAFASAPKSTVETRVLEFSPAGHFVRLDNVGINHFHAPWGRVSEVTLLEVLNQEEGGAA